MKAKSKANFNNKDSLPPNTSHSHPCTLASPEDAGEVLAASLRAGPGEGAALKPTGSPRAWALKRKFKARVDGKGEKHFKHKRRCFLPDLSSAGDCLSYTQKSPRGVAGTRTEMFQTKYREVTRREGCFLEGALILKQCAIVFYLFEVRVLYLHPF